MKMSRQIKETGRSIVTY